MVTSQESFQGKWGGERRESGRKNGWVKKGIFRILCEAMAPKRQQDNILDPSVNLRIKSDLL